MQAIVFVAAFAACVVAASVVLWWIEPGQSRQESTSASELDIHLPVHSRPALYDWAERGDFS